MLKDYASTSKDYASAARVSTREACVCESDSLRGGCFRNFNCLLVVHNKHQQAPSFGNTSAKTQGTHTPA